jgi:aspartate/methionine/tyrosine aminotransferase
MDNFEYAHSRRDIVWMSQNNNNIPTTPRIKNAIIKALEDGEHTLYPQKKGFEDLPQLVIKDLGLKPESHDASITNGGIEALYGMNRALLRPGDEVICSDPSFMPIHDQIRLAGATPVELPIYEAPWKLTPERIKAAITPKTRMILLIDPINPLGTSYAKSEVREIAEIARSKDLWLVDDVTYRDFAYKHTLSTEFYAEKTILIYSFSKSCGLAGLRIGALVAPPDIMKTIKPYDTNVLGANILSQVAAKAALETKDKWLDKVLKVARDNQKIIKECVQEIKGATLPVYPSNANLFCIDISGTGAEPDKIEEKLLHEYQVFVRSGNYVSKKFGPKFVRVSFTVPTAQCKRFARAFPKVVQEQRT